MLGVWLPTLGRELLALWRPRIWPQVGPVERIVASNTAAIKGPWTHLLARQAPPIRE